MIDDSNRRGIDTLAPEFDIRIDGQDLPLKAKVDLQGVTVHEDIGAASMFALRIMNWEGAQAKVKWVDDDLFREGREVRVHMGYRDRTDEMIAGEITGLEPEFLAEDVPMLTVRGYDRRHRLMRCRKTHSFLKMKDSDIASQIARDASLIPRTEDTAVMHDYVLQHNQTDLEFLAGRAARIGYEVVVDDTTLYFRPPQNTGSEAVTLRRSVDLMEFWPRLTTMTQVPEVHVRGWDRKEKKEIVGKAKVGDETTTMGGENSGPKTAQGAFDQAESSRVNRPVFSQPEADQIAKGLYNEMALAHITGEGVCIGRTDLRPGKLIKMEDLGRRFSGLYYVTSTTHVYSIVHGYRTEFTCRRNAT